MILKKTEVGQERDCGLIIKPFQGPWTLNPNQQASPLRRKWIVIPLSVVGIYDDYLQIYSITNSYYEVSSSVTIVEPAMIILVHLSGGGSSGYVSHRFTESIFFDRDDLYTSHYGLYLHPDLTFADKHLVISAFYRIYIRYGEINNEKPFFRINEEYKIEKSSGIKSGQFIL